MTGERGADRLAGFGIPQPRGLVRGCGDDARAVGTEHRAVHGILVPDENVTLAQRPPCAVALPFRLRYVNAIDASGLADADVRAATDEVGVLEARHVLLPALEHDPGIGAALHLGPRQVRGHAGIGADTDGMHVGLVGCENEDEARPVKHLELAGRVRRHQLLPAAPRRA